MILKLFGLRKKDKLRRMSTKRKERKEKERDYRYTAVMRALVWRYVSAMQRQADDNPVTEDDVNEIKGEITSMRYELLEVLERNGVDVSSADRREKMVLGKKMKVWERRLMKDFHLAPVAPEEEMDILMKEPPPDEDPLSKWRRVAKLAVLNSAQQKWRTVVQGACKASQIGHCNNRESFKNQQCLQKAMNEAKKLVTRSPRPVSRASSPASIHLPDPTGSSIMELLHDISQETGSNVDDKNPSNKKKPPKGGASGAANTLLGIKMDKKPQTSPQPRSKSAAVIQHKDQRSDGSEDARTESKPSKPRAPSVPTERCDSTTISIDEDIIAVKTERLDIPTLSVTPAVTNVNTSKKRQSPKSPIKNPSEIARPQSPRAKSPPCIVGGIPTIPPPTTPTRSPGRRQRQSPAPTPRASPSKTASAPPKNNLPKDATNSVNAPVSLTSSRDPLIPKDSPESLRTAPRQEETKPAKRQPPKTGWL